MHRLNQQLLGNPDIENLGLDEFMDAQGSMEGIEALLSGGAEEAKLDNTNSPAHDQPDLETGQGSEPPQPSQGSSCYSLAFFIIFILSLAASIYLSNRSWQKREEKKEVPRGDIAKFFSFMTPDACNTDDDVDSCYKAWTWFETFFPIALIFIPSTLAIRQLCGCVRPRIAR